MGYMYVQAYRQNKQCNLYGSRERASGAYIVDLQAIITTPRKPYVVQCTLREPHCNVKSMSTSHLGPSCLLNSSWQQEMWGSGTKC